MEDLGYLQIKQIIASYAKSSDAKEQILMTVPFESKEALQEELNILDAFFKAEELGLDADFFTPLTTEDTFLKLSKGEILYLKGLLMIERELELVEGVKEVFKDVLPALKEKVEGMTSFTSLRENLKRTIKNEEELYPDASPLLRQLKNEEKKLLNLFKSLALTEQRKYEMYLQSGEIVIKNGHYCLQVKNAYKHKVPGIIEEVSQTGSTYFITPYKLLENENTLKENRANQEQEILRIVVELNKEVTNHLSELLVNHELLIYFDVLKAKYLFSKEYKATIPMFSDVPLLNLKGARHPLLDQSKVVPNDFLLNQDTRLLLISGANAGGKTVALKTVGLLFLMAVSCFPVTVNEGSLFFKFHALYFDIGDNQSLSDNLSTFQAHLAALKRILEKTIENDLILVDEIGSGTSVEEGVAISKAVINSLLKKHCFALISSHFEELKSFVPHLKGAENAALLFSEKEGKPLYILKPGLPGESYGLLLARKMGLPEDVMSDAENYFKGMKNMSLSSALQKLQARELALDNLIKDAQKKEEALKEQERLFKIKNQKLLEKEEYFKKDLKREKEKILEEYEESLSSLLKGSSSSLPNIIKTKKAMEETLKDEEQEEEKLSDNQDITLKSYVSCPSFFVEGEVTNIKGDKVTFVTEEGLSFTVNKNLLRLKKKPEKPVSFKKEKKDLDQKIRRATVPLEINLVGMRYDEAYQALDRYFNNVLVSGLKRIRIIHGFGSGILRNMTKQYLDEHKEYIKSYNLADEHEGGGGATICLLK